MGQARKAREAAREAEPSKGTGRVVMAYVHGAEVRSAFHESLMRMLVHDMGHHQRIVGGGGRVAQWSSANVSNARNNVVRRFLDESDAEWMLMLDTDMTFEPTLCDDLLEAAHAAGAPIVGGLCFGVADGEVFPTMYWLSGTPELPKMLRLNAWPRRVEDNPTHPLIRVDATGAACLLIHRDVLVAMREKFAEPFPWFREEVLGEPPWGTSPPGSGSPMGEDITFCLRAGALGFPIHVHIGVDVGHEKHWTLTLEQYDAQRAALQPVQEEGAA